MARKNQTGQIVIEFIFVFIFFAAILILLQGLIESRRAYSGKYKLSKEVQSAPGY